MKFADMCYNIEYNKNKGSSYVMFNFNYNIWQHVQTKWKKFNIDLFFQQRIWTSLYSKKRHVVNKSVGLYGQIIRPPMAKKIVFEISITLFVTLPSQVHRCK